jgi:hypothetical protein
MRDPQGIRISVFPACIRHRPHSLKTTRPEDQIAAPFLNDFKPL